MYGLRAVLSGSDEDAEEEDDGEGCREREGASVTAGAPAHEVCGMRLLESLALDGCAGKAHVDPCSGRKALMMPPDLLRALSKRRKRTDRRGQRSKMQRQREEMRLLVNEFRALDADVDASQHGEAGAATSPRSPCRGTVLHTLKRPRPADEASCAENVHPHQRESAASSSSSRVRAEAMAVADGTMHAQPHSGGTLLVGTVQHAERILPKVAAAPSAGELDAAGASEYVKCASLSGNVMWSCATLQRSHRSMSSLPASLLWDSPAGNVDGGRRNGGAAVPSANGASIALGCSASEAPDAVCAHEADGTKAAPCVQAWPAASDLCKRQRVDLWDADTRDVVFQLLQVEPEPEACSEVHAGCDGACKAAGAKSMTMLLFGATADGLSVLVRASGVRPYVLFSRPTGWPDDAWDVLLQRVTCDLRAKADAHCLLEPVMRKSLFGLHYQELLEFVRVEVCSTTALALAINYLASPIRDVLLSPAHLGDACKAWNGMTDDGVRLEIFEDRLDFTTHFLADFQLHPGGWVRMRRGRFCPVGHGNTLSSCSLEFLCNFDTPSRPPLEMLEVERTTPPDSPHEPHGAHDAKNSSHDRRRPLEASLQQRCTGAAANAGGCQLAPLSLLSLDVAPRALPPRAGELSLGDEGHCGTPLTFISATFIRHEDAGSDPGCKEQVCLLFCVGAVQAVENIGGHAHVAIKSFKNERSMLLAFQQDVCDHIDPDVLVVYDSQVLCEIVSRFELYNVPARFSLGRLRGHGRGRCRAEAHDKGRGQRAVAVCGRIVLAVQDVLQKEEQTHKLRDWSLEAAAVHYLDDRRELHLRPFDAVRMCAGDLRQRSLIGLNLVKRSQVPICILLKLHMLVSCVEMARVTGVLPDALLSRDKGEQYKALSQLCRACKELGFVIPGVNSLAADAHPNAPADKALQGGKVLEPVRAAHMSPICALDFASLYPSIIMAHNLSYETLVRQDPRQHPAFAGQRVLSKLPVEHFNLDGRSDAQGTSDGKHPSPGVRACFWRKGALGAEEGVLVRIVRRLVESREQTLALLREEIQQDVRVILHHRQLAYKKSCNAMYGLVGSCHGKDSLPCTALAATITAIGRELLAHTITAIQQHYSVANGFHADAAVVYGDTDSVMVDFKLDSAWQQAASSEEGCCRGCSSLPASRQCDKGECSRGTCDAIARAFALGTQAAHLVTETLPTPICLRFEKVYSPLLLFEKKYYAGRVYTHDIHKAQNEVEVKGFVRRSSCRFVCNTILECFDMLLKSDLSNGVNKDAAVQFASSKVALLIAGQVPVQDLVMCTSLSRTADKYKRRLDHVELAVRNQKCGVAYQVDRRVQFVRVLPGAGAVHEIEDPVLAVQKGLAIDLSWYLQHQLREPLTHIFGLIVANPDRQIFGASPGAPSQTVQRVDNAKHPSLERLLASGRDLAPRCFKCEQVISDRKVKSAQTTPLHTSSLCASCAADGEDLLMDVGSKMLEAQHAADELLSICLGCTGEMRAQHELANLCCNSSCKTLYARARARIDIETSSAALHQLEGALAGLSAPSAGANTDLHHS